MSVLLLLQAGDGAAAPDFGIRWATLLAIFGLIAILMFAIRLVGIAAANARPDEPADAPTKGATVATAGSASSAPGMTLSGTPDLAPSALANIERRTVVLITAAVAALDGPRVRILDIRRVQGGNISSQQAWSMEGRREIYLSHRIR